MDCRVKPGNDERIDQRTDLMVEFTLPKNSKVREGKSWPAPTGAHETREYRIYRWNPEDGENPRIDTYYVDTDDCGPMILDALIYIKNKIDRSEERRVGKECRSRRSSTD